MVSSGSFAWSDEPGRTPSYWIRTFDSQPARCVEKVGPFADLRAFFEKKHGVPCEQTEENALILFQCGKTKEVVLLARESCAHWMGGSLTEDESYQLAVFVGCYRKARTKLDTDTAVLYCRCVSALVGSNKSAYSAMTKKAQDEVLAGYARQCVVGMEAATPREAAPPSRAAPE